MLSKNAAVLVDFDITYTFCSLLPFLCVTEFFVDLFLSIGTLKTSLYFRILFLAHILPLTAHVCFNKINQLRCLLSSSEYETK